MNIENYLSHLKNNRNFVVATINKQRQNLERLQLFLEEKNLDYLKVKSADLADWINYRRSSEVKDASIEQELCCFRGFYHYLFETKQIRKNPAAAIPKVICELPAEKIYLSVDECMQLLNSIDRQTDIGLRDFTMIATLWCTGLRTFECAGLCWNNINFDEGTLRVVGKGGKERQVFLNERIWDTLQDYALAVEYQDEDPIFCTMKGGKVSEKKKHFTNTSLNNAVKTLAKRAGLGREITTLTFRHTFATHMFEAGVPIDDIKEIIGHERETETCIYIHVTLDGVRSLLTANKRY
jgi:integrase/recombinase XerD